MLLIKTYWPYFSGTCMKLFQIHICNFWCLFSVYKSLLENTNAEHFARIFDSNESSLMCGWCGKLLKLPQSRATNCPDDFEPLNALLANGNYSICGKYRWLDKYSNCILRRWHLSTGMWMYHKHRYHATLYHWRNNSRSVREKCEPKLVENFGVQSKYIKSILLTQWKVFQHEFCHWICFLLISQSSDHEQIPLSIMASTQLFIKDSSELSDMNTEQNMFCKYYVDPHSKLNYSWWAALIRTLFVLF